MFGKKYKREVVPESDYTDFSTREEDKSELADTNTYIQVGLVSSTVLLGYKVFVSPPPTVTPTPIPVTSPVMIEPVLTTPISQPIQPLVLGESSIQQPVGYIADKSLEALAFALDPLIQIMVAISFPIASVIMVGSCFFFMFGNNEKGWDGIMKAGLGYVLIQISPLFLDILKNVGKSVGP